jgi:hypothetical protein
MKRTRKPRQRRRPKVKLDFSGKLVDHGGVICRPGAPKWWEPENQGQEGQSEANNP